MNCLTYLVNMNNTVFQFCVELQIFASTKNTQWKLILNNLKKKGIYIL